MSAIAASLQVYALTFIICFFMACLIKILLFVIRRFSGDNKTQTKNES
ncbi:MAG: hypothetical protein GX091_05020 [Peptococcaceae bacterium]|nr:hypothetical protein [Peptococcaceae bacterium]